MSWYFLSYQFTQATALTSAVRIGEWIKVALGGDMSLTIVIYPANAKTEERLAKHAAERSGYQP